MKGDGIKAVTKNTLQHDTVHDTNQYSKNREWIKNWLDQSRAKDE